MASKELFDDGDVFNTKPCAVCVDTAAGLNILGGSGEKKWIIHGVLCRRIAEEAAVEREVDIFIWNCKWLQRPVFFFEPLLARGRR